MKQTQDERLAYLTAYLWNEAHGDTPIVDEGRSKWELYRGLQNVRPPKPIDDAFIQVQDAYLSELNQKHVTYIEDLEPELNQNIYLWQGDITTLAVDGIVNAANSKFLGCMQANHNCIDNIIHTKAGVQLRLACDEIIKKQGKKEGVGKAKITSAYNLPSQYVIHTVGPQVQRKPVSQMNKDLLAKSYRSCLKLADENGLKHLAFCCISTGVFGFPQEEAAKIAIETTLNYLNETNSPIKVIFNVFKDKDFQLYKEALSQHE
ncbi:protein-ADP-ribose hydrolase [Mammaliicoccus lentus]|uniref:protein-ADP-ribose hydrolase n=1 Tax=Mammaliicoccus lentus TaxID=42858 RepID=UPI003CFB467E